MEPTDPTQPLDLDPFDGMNPADHGTDTPSLDARPLGQKNKGNRDAESR